MQGGRVLVVDDEPGLRRLLSDLFSLEGYRVSTAGDGAQALERLAAFRPDVVVLDLTMPVMSGLTFAEKCHRMDGYANLPIVAVTAMHDVDGVEPRLENLGVRKCLAKPFDVAELLAVVEQLARPNRPHSSAVRERLPRLR
ncbi:MAG: response regulator [Chloroflexota bacterium]|nr:response regulator [Chloroflexota bacterium]